MNAIIPTNFTAGVRRLKTLGGYHGVMGQLGDVRDIANGMIAEGYNALIVKNLVDGGATEAQLQSLWDNYSSDTAAGFGRAATDLQNQLSITSILPNPMVPLPGVPTPSDPGAFNSAIVNVGGQVFDLAKKETWDSIAGLLTSTRDKINEVARLGPRDTDVIQHVQDFNSKVAQFAGWYQSLFGSAPSSIPYATTLGVAPFVIPAAIIAGAAVVISAAYAYGQWADVTKARLLAQTQSALIAANASPGQINAILNSTAGITGWLQQNFGTVAALLVAVAIGVPLIKKL